MLLTGLAAAGCSNDAAHDASMQDKAHHDGVNERGDKVMGFDHDKTTHHFRLFGDGGAIEVTANDAADTASRDQIRQHLAHIATKFADGDFNAPMMIHNREPDGVATLKNLKSEVKYVYSDLPNGGVVRITTANKEALDAVHAFMRFQISDHKTGDPTTVQ